MYYILTKKQIARRKEKSLHGKHKWDEIVVLEGSLWFTQDPDSTPRQYHSHASELILHSEEHNGAVLRYEHGDVKPLSGDQYNLLLALTVCSERLKVFMDPAWLKEAAEIAPGSTVYVLSKYSISQEKLVGKVRYKGILPGAQGIWFGVELSAPHKGKGNSDGMYKHQQLFQCGVDCGMFVAINRLRKCPDSVTFKANSPLPDAPVIVGERVVWISDKGAELGTVRWVGVLHDCKTGDLTVGIEFDNNVGTGTGKYRDRQLFRTKQGHASLIPPIGLMKAKEYFPDTPAMQDAGASHAATTLRPSASMRSASTNSSTATTRYCATLPPSRPDPSRTQPEQSIYDHQPAHTVDNDTGTYRPAPALRTDTVTYRPAHTLTTDSAKYRVAPTPVTAAYQPSHTLENTGVTHADVEHQGARAKVSHQRRADAAEVDSDEEDGHTDLIRPRPVYHTAPMAAASNPRSSLSPNLTAPLPRPKSKTQNGEANGDYFVPKPLDPAEAGTDLELNSTVEVCGNPEYCRYGVIRWIGYIHDKNKPIAGLEMEEESGACTDGIFGQTRLFTCPRKKGFFVHLKKLRRDGRFEEFGHDLNRRESLAFGTIDCPEVQGMVAPPSDVTELSVYVGKSKGIQGHHNSCYLDAMLFSMFSFSLAFDQLLHRPRRRGDIDEYEQVQSVLRDCIVNPLRRNFFVRADKVLKLRRQLDKLGSVEGLTSEEKDPEEFLSSLLEQIMKADPFIQLNSGQQSYFYQLFLEKDEHIVLPTTQQLLGLSFLQSNIKLLGVPSCLILQMPRFGKDYRMYKRIMPSLFLDITDILDKGPRACTICDGLAEYECKDCYKKNNSGLDQIAYCVECLRKSHHRKRRDHKPQKLKVNQEYIDFMEKNRGTHDDVPIKRQLMELFAVVCIETSHYVAFVKCGTGDDAPWVFADSMADRLGGQNGYNVPEVTPCPLLPEWLQQEDHANILACPDDKQLPEHMRRILCDAYICMYQSREVIMYG